jgi:hypothetical protein
LGVRTFTALHVVPLRTLLMTLHVLAMASRTLPMLLHILTMAVVAALMAALVAAFVA